MRKSWNVLLVMIFVFLFSFLVISQVTAQDKEKININKAGVEKLQTLNGVGEAIANNIVEYRNENEFDSIQEIKKVDGIGKARFQDIKDRITVGS